MSEYSGYAEPIKAENWRHAQAGADEALGGRDARIRMDTVLARELGLSRPWVSGPKVGRCPGSGEYGHGMSLTTVHRNCCQAWDQARALAVRSAHAEAGS